MSNLGSINCFDTHGNGQNDPVIFTGQTQTSQKKLGTTTNNRIYQNYELLQFYIIHTQRYHIIFQYLVIF
jgi:hypothetical protein